MPLVYRETPESGAIEVIGYDPVTSELRIVFRGKEGYPEYIWGGFPASQAQDFLFARSKGEWYHRYLKDRKEYKIRPALGSFRLSAIVRRLSRALLPTR